MSSWCAITHGPTSPASRQSSNSLIYSLSLTYLLTHSVDKSSLWVRNNDANGCLKVIMGILMRTTMIMMTTTKRKNQYNNYYIYYHHYTHSHYDHCHNHFMISIIIIITMIIIRIIITMIIIRIIITMIIIIRIITMIIIVITITMIIIIRNTP